MHRPTSETLLRRHQTRGPISRPPLTAGTSHGVNAAYGQSTTAAYGQSTTATYEHGTTAAYGHGTTATYGHGTTAAYGQSTTTAYGHGTTAGYGHGTTAVYGHGTHTGLGHNTNKDNNDSDRSMHNENPTRTQPQYHITQSDPEDSDPSNYTYRPRQSRTPTQSHPEGSLLSCFPCPASTPNNDAEHILIWLEIMVSGPLPFEREIARNLWHTEMKPALFAILPKWSETVKLAHGFSTMLLNNHEHWVDGKVGLFLGDHIAVPLAIGHRRQDPRLVLTRSFQTLLASFSGIPASEQCIARNPTTPAPASTKGNTVTLHKLFPIPQSWWPFFLQGNRTPGNTLVFITHTTSNWTSDIGKEAAARARLWARSACTADTRNTDTSALAIRINVDEGDTKTIRWATQHLQSYLLTPGTTHPEPTTNNQPTNSSADAMVLMAQQSMQMAQSLIDRDMDRSDPSRCAPKQLPDDIVCHLLGLCGLPWIKCDQLPKIWQSLHQQADQKGRDIILRQFFQQLGEHCPDLEHFHSSQLFKHIVQHKFIPGNSYDTCHHGLSILAISLRSFSVQEQEQREEEFFREATNKTQDSIRKHKTKGPPALPTLIGELLLLLDRLITLTKGLFTTTSPMLIQLTDLRLVLRRRHHTLMSDPRRTAERIPQLVWALIKATQQFYGTVCTKDDLDPMDGDLPCLPTATLDAYTFLLKAELPIEVDGIPEQWLLTHKRPTMMQPAPPPKPTNQTDAQPKQQTQNPFNPSSNTSGTHRTYTNQPAIFANNEALHELRTK